MYKSFETDLPAMRRDACSTIPLQILDKCDVIKYKGEEVSIEYHGG
jgi:hypothetical protein